MHRVKFHGSVMMAALLLAASGVSTAGPPNDPAATWRKLLPAIERAEKESLAMVEAQVAAVGERFDRAKGKARAFAEEALGTEAKLRYAAGGVEQAAGFFQGLFEAAVGASPSPTTDSFSGFIRGRFEAHVLDPSAFKKELEEIASGYGHRLRGLESRLYLKVAADVPDEDVKLDSSIPGLKIPGSLFEQVDKALGDAVSDCTADFATMVGKETVSWIGGDLLAQAGMSAMRGNTQSGGAVEDVVIGVVAGLVVDQLVGKAMEAAGYDPVGTLTGRVSARLEAAKKAVVEGDPELTNRYLSLVVIGLDHPDAKVREAFDRAARAMERNAPLSIRATLMGLHHRRCYARRVALLGLVFGPEARKPGGIYVNVDRMPDAKASIKIAENYLARYGDK